MTKNNAPLPQTLRREVPDEEKYPAGWRRTTAQPVTKGPAEKPVIRIGVPLPVDQFRITLNDFGQREISAPGYVLPSELRGMWCSVTDAIHAIRRFQSKGVELEPEQQEAEQIPLPLTEEDMQILKRKGGAQ